MTNWTKGPWRVLEGKYGLQIFSAKHWIANIKCESCPAHEKGNAHLIAAAPELYEALEAMLSLWGSVMRAQGFDPDHVVEPAQARAALSKARGEAQ